MNGYLIPANSKKGTLIFNLFRPIDLWILCTGIAVSFVLLSIFNNGANLLLNAISILPGCICGLLVFPVPNYHNVLCAIISIYNFYTERRKYVWKGWCFYERFGEESSKSKK